MLEQKNTELEARNNMKPCVISFLSALRRLHPELETRCLNGSCFKLYLLLREVWPDADPWYDGDHVIIKIGNAFYDIRGEVVPGRHIPMKDDALVFNTAYFWDKEHKNLERMGKTKRVDNSHNIGKTKRNSH